MQHRPYTLNQANIALVLLLLAYILSFIDRNIMSVLIGPIRQDFNISDFQYSLLHGFAFSMFYITLGLPIARLADKYPRFNIISIGILLWSFMTCVCGFTKNFFSLFFARMGVGVGEAALSPAAFSILSDIYPKEKLPQAIAIYSLGITIGGGLAYILGGIVYEYFSTVDLETSLFFSNLQPWQMTFLAVGLPGFLIALCLKCLPEPPRTSNQIPLEMEENNSSLRDVLNFFNSNWRVYIGIIGSMSLMSVLGYGIMAWYPELLIRIYDIDRSTAGSHFGLVFIVAGSTGALLGGWVCSSLISRGVIDAPVRVIICVAVLWAIPTTIAPFSNSAELAMIMAWPIVFFLNSYFGIGVSAIVLATPHNMRAQASAILLFFTNLFGLTFGPTAVAILTDFIFVGDEYLGASLGILPLIVLPPALILALIARKPYINLVKTQTSQ
ncbi:MAG: spinster family MFS transporter [Candidatus Puniceispirillales bacterium]